jgi:hypothetical protein
MKKLLEANVAYGSRRISQVFADFCELSAIAIRNAVDARGRDVREARYMQIIGGYTPAEADRFAQLLAALTQKFEDGLGDHLGELYMSLDLGSDRLGQFFTPFDVSRVIAKMTIGDYSAKLAGQPFITVAEPACGSGGMVIALADALREIGVNYQQTVHVTAQDLDQTAVHMTYIQLSLLHIPAVVVRGNTLSLEQLDVWHTPAHVLGGWDARLAQRAAADAALTLVPAAAPGGAATTTPNEDDDEDRSAA